MAAPAPSLAPEALPPSGQSAVTSDSLFQGRLICHQNRTGYRFSVDAVLLAHFIAPVAGARLLDLGAGCGVISLILAYRHPQVTITALELQPSLFSLLEHNVKANGLEDRVTPLSGDLCQIGAILPAGAFDWALCNPPYRRTGSGRVNPVEEQAIARHELTANLTAVLAALAHCLRVGGRAALVYPAGRAASLISGLRTAGLEPKRLQVVYSRPDGPAQLVLVEAMKEGGEELALLPPWYIYQREKGPMTPAMQRLYEP